MYEGWEGCSLVGFPCDVRVDVKLVEGVGGLGVAGTLEEVEVVADLGELLDGTNLAGHSNCCCFD